MLEHDWFPAPLPGNVTVGPRSWVYSSYAFVHCRSDRPIAIGADTGVYAGTFFDLGERGSARIGDFCTIVGAILSGDVEVTIEDYAFVAHEVVIADSPWAAPDRSDEPAEVRIGRNAWIGARAILLPGAAVGDDAIVGAGTVLSTAVPAGAVAAGNPARIVAQPGA